MSPSFFLSCCFVLFFSVFIASRQTGMELVCASRHLEGVTYPISWFSIFIPLSIFTRARFPVYTYSLSRCLVLAGRGGGEGVEGIENVRKLNGPGHDIWRDRDDYIITPAICFFLY